MANEKPILVTGATGRLGLVLQSVWPTVFAGEIRPIWHGRAVVPKGGLRWDVLRESYAGPDLSGGVILNLAGVTGGDPQSLGDNSALAQAAWQTAVAQGARHLFVVSSAAVYGPGMGVDLTEDAPLAPANPYGQAKVAMERLVADWPKTALGITILRIGNVVGSDALIGRATPDREVVLDPIPDGPGGPERSYIGPVLLARVLGQLCQMAAQGVAMPRVLNIAAPGAVAMADLLQAAGLRWRFGPENPAVVPRVVLDTMALQRLLPLPNAAGQAQSMIDDWRSLGAGRNDADQTSV